MLQLYCFTAISLLFIYVQTHTALTKKDVMLKNIFLCKINAFTTLGYGNLCTYIQKEMI